MEIRKCHPQFKSWFSQSLLDLWPIVLFMASLYWLFHNQSVMVYIRESASKSTRTFIYAFLIFIGYRAFRFAIKLLQKTWYAHKLIVCFDDNAIWIVGHWGTPRLNWNTLTEANLYIGMNLLIVQHRMLSLVSSAPKFILKDGRVEPLRYPFVVHLGTFSPEDQTAILDKVRIYCLITESQDDPPI